MSTQDKNKGLRNIAIYVGGVMVIIYLFIGLALVFTPAFSEVLGANKKLIGILVLVYAAYRSWLTYRLIRVKKGLSQK
jgi:hypothetical protein